MVFRSEFDPPPRSPSVPALFGIVAVVLAGIAVSVYGYVDSTDRHPTAEVQAASPLQVVEHGDACSTEPAAPVPQAAACPAAVSGPSTASTRTVPRVTRPSATAPVESPAPCTSTEVGEEACSRSRSVAPPAARQVGSTLARPPSGT
jgi:hypothetical protein